MRLPMEDKQTTPARESDHEEMSSPSRKRARASATS
jgi:hypothetical protein